MHSEVDDSHTRRTTLKHKPTMATTSRGMVDIRDVSRFQREKRNEYICGLQTEAQKAAQDIHDSDTRNRETFEVFQSLRSTYTTAMSFLLKLCFSSSVRSQPSLLSTSLADLEVILTPTVTVTMPEANTHYCRPSRVEFGRSVFSGLPSLLTYSEGYEAFCCAVARTATATNITSILVVQSLLVPDTVVVEGSTATARFTVRSVNAVLCGGAGEFTYGGMIMVSFSSDARVRAADIFYNADEVFSKLRGCLGESSLFGCGCVHRLLSSAAESVSTSGVAAAATSTGTVRQSLLQPCEGNKQISEQCVFVTTATMPSSTVQSLNAFRLCSICDCGAGQFTSVEAASASASSIPSGAISHTSPDSRADVDFAVRTVESTAGELEAITTFDVEATLLVRLQSEQSMRCVAERAAQDLPWSFYHPRPSTVFDPRVTDGRITAHGKCSGGSSDTDSGGGVLVQVFPLFASSDSSVERRDDDAHFRDRTDADGPQRHLLWVVTRCAPEPLPTELPNQLITLCLSAVLREYRSRQTGQWRQQAKEEAGEEALSLTATVVRCGCTDSSSGPPHDSACCVAPDHCSYRQAVRQIVSTAEAILQTETLRSATDTRATASFAAPQQQQQLVAAQRLLRMQSFVQWCQMVESCAGLQCAAWQGLQVSEPAPAPPPPPPPPEPQQQGQSDLRPSETQRSADFSTADTELTVIRSTLQRFLTATRESGVAFPAL